MFDENQLVEMRWTNVNKKRFIDMGYEFTSLLDYFMVKAKDLTHDSTKLVNVTCDYCGKLYKSEFGNLMRRKNKFKDACNNCRDFKQHEATLAERAKYQFDKIRKICAEEDYELLTDESEFTNVLMDIYYLCKKHGVQSVTIDSFVQGHRCRACSYEKRGLNCRHSKEYIKSIVESYNGNKLLNAEEYIGANEHNLRIECGSCGSVYATSFSDYVRNKQIRCSSCSQSESIGEMVIRKLLENNSVNFIQEKKFDDCRDIRCLPFDFYLPAYNLIIEFDGKHHFEETGFGNYEITKKHDEIKNQYCQSHNIDLLRIPYWDGNNIEDIIINKLNL